MFRLARNGTRVAADAFTVVDYETEIHREMKVYRIDLYRASSPERNNFVSQILRRRCYKLGTKINIEAFCNPDF